MLRTCRKAYFTRCSHPSSRGPESTERHHTPQAEIELSRLHRRLRLRASRCRYLRSAVPPLSSSPRHYKKSTSILEGGKSLDRNRPCISWPLHQLALHQLALQLQPLARPVIYPRPDGLTLVLGKRTLPRVLFPPASSADFCWVTVCVSVEAGRKQVANKETLQPEIPNLLLPACFCSSVAGSQFRRLEMQRCMPVHG